MAPDETFVQLDLPTNAQISSLATTKDVEIACSGAAGSQWGTSGSRFTLAFQDLACWLATHCSQSTVATYLRTTWRSIGYIIAGRVMTIKWPAATTDLRRIGIDEISSRKGPGSRRKCLKGGSAMARRK